MPDAGCQMPDTGYQLLDTRYGVTKGERMKKNSGLRYSEIHQTPDDEGWMLRDNGKPMSYRELKTWQLAREVTIRIHRMTMEKLPRFELHEEGSQIRRSAKSVRSNIVEGFGRRHYKQDFVRYLVYAESSSDETLDHLDTLFETGSLKDRELYSTLHGQVEELGKRLNRFIAAVESQHMSER